MADRYARAVAAIDAANAADPHRITFRGDEGPKELIHAGVVERWVRTLDPDADELQLLAARAHHLRRWVVPRTDYPAGRAGYLRWRTDHKARQAAEAAELLAAAGYAPDEVAQVADLVAKRGCRGDDRAQTHEDALCLAFLELQLDDVAGQLDRDHLISVLRKTMAKMSPAGLAAAGSLALSDEGAALLAAAAAPEAAAPDA